MRLTTPALVVYLMAADDTPELAEAAVRGGATAIEIGIPYSDPLADGPTIQRAGQRSLDAGMTPPKALEILAEVNRRVAVPLINPNHAVALPAAWIKNEHRAGTPAPQPA